VLRLCHADPENKLYDILKLNRGIKETFFTPSTPFAFLERFTKPDGTKELLEVLFKWNKGKNTRSISPRIFHNFLIYGDSLTRFLCIAAVFIPPEQSQAFNQGGTFVFDGPTTVFAHYDESTGAHSDIQEVLGLVKERAEKKAIAK
jgi:hypothetical protein